MHTNQNHSRQGFSLVEALAAVAIIGVITFLALPNIVTVKQDSERNLAIARAEAFNMATAAFIQANGRANAETAWAAGADEQARYALAAPFLAFAPTNETDYMPEGYDLAIWATIASFSKVPLTGPGGAINY